MLKYLIVVSSFFYSQICLSQTADEKAIRASLHSQTVAWNNGDLVGFMQSYWDNDSLIFIGSAGPTYGYDKTLANYKKNYPSKDYMGQLNFDLIQIRPLHPNLYFVIGKWALVRKAGNVGGHYTLLLKKIKGVWKIIADHSS